MTGILKGDIIIRKSFFKIEDLAATRGNRPEPGVRRGRREEAPAGTLQKPPVEAAKPNGSFCRGFFQKAGKVSWPSLLFKEGGRGKESAEK